MPSGRHGTPGWTSGHAMVSACRRPLPCDQSRDRHSAWSNMAPLNPTNHGSSGADFAPPAKLLSCCRKINIEPRRGVTLPLWEATRTNRPVQSCRNILAPHNEDAWAVLEYCGARDKPELVYTRLGTGLPQLINRQTRCWPPCCKPNPTPFHDWALLQKTIAALRHDHPLPH